MSFETTWNDFAATYSDQPFPTNQQIGKFFYEAGRAEAEAQIATLQLEKDALRDALRGTMKVILDAKATGVIHIDQGAINRNQVMLSAPTSGEPARKP